MIGIDSFSSSDCSTVLILEIPDVNAIKNIKRSHTHMPFLQEPVDYSNRPVV